MAPARNVCVGGVWYGPDYRDAGEPPAGKVDEKFLGRKADGPDDEPDPVGWAAVKTREQAAQFAAGGAVLVDDTDDEDRDVPALDPVGSKAVETEEEAAAFRGRPTRASSTSAVGDKSARQAKADESTADADTGTKPATRTRSK